MIRVGLGFDAHRFGEGRSLRLGGLTIAHDRGLQGYSDADVLLHAICDALLGAAALGDLGTYFPSNDPAWRGADSRIFVEKVLAMLQKAGWKIVNVDTIIIAQEPKLFPYRESIRKSIAGCLGIDVHAVSLKATTTDQMGFTGRKEGIAAQAIALLEK